jgi:hypothetical protein
VGESVGYGEVRQNCVQALHPRCTLDRWHEYAGVLCRVQRPDDGEDGSRGAVLDLLIPLLVLGKFMMLTILALGLFIAWSFACLAVNNWLEGRWPLHNPFRKEK